MGVPQIGCSCAVCRSDDPRDRRNRTSALIEHRGIRLLIDTSPELRLQLLAANVGHINAVLYTHHHADHVHGIDDLRSISVATGRSIALYGPPETIAHIVHRFNYIFDDAEVPVPGTSKPRLEPNVLTAGQATDIAGLTVLPLAFGHGNIEVFGYRVGDIGYVTDVKAVSEEAITALRGVEVLVLNALWWREHPTHLSIPEAVDVARAIGAPRTLLTHLTHETSHQSLLDQLPSVVRPGYDGLVIEI